MSDTARDYQKIETASTEGLEDFFADATQCEASDLLQGAVATHCEYTIIEASQFLKVSPSTIYRRIKAGKYQTKTDPDGTLKVIVRSGDLHCDASGTRSDIDALQCEAVDLHCDAVATQQDDLTKAFIEMSYKLQHATYRNGWLESKLEEFQIDIAQRDQQIKLLTDSQHKPAWWRRFYSWFIGR